MIGTMLKPFFKKFFGLFLSMVFVSSLSIALLTAFASTIYNLQTTFETYLEDYGDVDSAVSIQFTTKEKADVSQVPGVASVEYRVSLDAYLKKESGRTITARLITFRDDDSSLFGRVVLDSTAKKEDALNVSVVRRFAEYNDFEVGDTIQMGYFGLFVDFYINEIIEAPEAIQTRVNNYVWSDNTDFGYVYLSESELDKAVARLATTLEAKIKESEQFAKYYDQVVHATGTTFPDLVDQYVIGERYTTKFTNQLLVKALPGYTQEELTYNLQTYLEGNDVKVKSATETHNQFYYLYIKNAIKQIRVAVVFLPVFFYSVTMIVIGLFVNQIIKSMTPQIGVMMSIGAGKKDIIAIFLVFSLIMSVVAGIVGSAVGVVLIRMLAKTMITVYSLPTIPFGVNVWIAASAVASLMVFALLATLISCQRIFKITPKDATISNEAARKHLPPKLEKAIDRSPMNLKLALNSIAQNPRRFFVSVFSIFASFVIILLSLFFYSSKLTLIDQTLNKRLVFDAQVYMSTIASEEVIENVKNQDCVVEVLDCYYTYTEVSTLDGAKRTYLECLAFDETVETDLVVIPDKNAKGSIAIQKEGLILPKSVASTLKVKEGDTVSVGGVPAKVVAISDQYFHPITYLSKTEMERLNLVEQSVSSFLVDVKDEDAFLAYMSQKNASLTVFTNLLRKDVHFSFNSINVFIYILIGFSFFMGFIILAIMSQNALMEQKRQLSVLRLIGFRILDVSNMWTVQSISQLLFSTLFALPIGSIAAIILFKMTSSSTVIYPFIFSIPAVLVAFAFIFAIILASHLISMISIRRWNLADNTRSRE